MVQGFKFMWKLQKKKKGIKRMLSALRPVLETADSSKEDSVHLGWSSSHVDDFMSLPSGLRSS